MDRRDTVDITLDGQVIEPRAGARPSWLNRALGIAILVAVVAASVVIAAAALWLAMILIPVAIVAAAVAYVLWRWQSWRRRRAQMPVVR